MTVTNRTLAETYLQMLNEHDPDMVDQFVAVDYINHNRFVADGREANRAFWADFFAALPDVQVTMEDLVVAEDRVVGRFVYRGTHRGEFFGIPASGRRVEAYSSGGQSSAQSSMQAIVAVRPGAAGSSSVNTYSARPSRSATIGPSGVLLTVTTSGVSACGVRALAPQMLRKISVGITRLTCSTTPICWRSIRTSIDERSWPSK